MHGLADIRHMNNLVLTNELARRRRLEAKRTGDNELEEATEYVKRLRNMTESSDQFDEGDINAIADLLVSAYGIQED